MHESQFSFGSKRKSAFDQLHRSFQRFTRTNQQMEMVWHHDKLMQQILPSRTILKENVEKEAGHSLGLKNIALLKCGGSDEVATVSSIAAPGSGHGKGTSAAQAAHHACHCIAAPKALRHPKARKCRPSPSLERG
jgi:hypothetical protein